MPIPPVSRDRIITALETFDVDCRESDEWQGWENRANQKYALLYEGRLYPPKMIISLATGVQRSEFTGGPMTNSYLMARGFMIVSLPNTGADRVAGIPEKPIAKKQLLLKHYHSVNREDMTKSLYSILLSLPRFDFTTTHNMLPENGIYFFFEFGENLYISNQRVVRVGTHIASGRFRGRIRQHYGSINTLRGNRNASVFRKHVGGALLRRENVDDLRLQEWKNQVGRSLLDEEEQVSLYMRNNCTFCCISVDTAEERLSLEQALIAQFAQHPIAQPSHHWLGHHAVRKEIRRSGLWNTQHIDAQPLTSHQFSRFQALTLHRG